jgi:hypothetical protein
MVRGQALVEPRALDQAGGGAGEVGERDAVAEPQPEVLERQAEGVLEPGRPTARARPCSAR